MVGGGTALGADRRHEDEVLHPGARGRARERGGRLVIDPVIMRWRDAAARMRNAGEMHDGVDGAEQRLPGDRLAEVAVRHLDAVGQGRRGAVPHDRAHPIACRR